jgi:hypothetical protein
MRIFFDEVHADPEIRRRFDASQVEFQKATETFSLDRARQRFREARTAYSECSAYFERNDSRCDAGFRTPDRAASCRRAPPRIRAREPESASNNLLLLAMTVIEIFTKGALAKQA